MKIVISFIVVLMYSFLHAQCDNRVSTNPSTVNNLALPDIDGQVNSPDTRYLNGFNWWADGFYQLTGMQYNPTQPYVDISNVQDPFQSAYYHYLVEALGAEEMNPQNGWELLLVNLGRFPDDETQVPDSPLREIPYIGLYNKYTGKLRLFVQYGYNQPTPLAVDGLKITVFYNDIGIPTNKSTILRLGNGIDKSLDQLNISPSLSAICPPNGSAVTQWMSADFQLTYDPCVCSFPTNLSVSFNFFSTTDFKLTGRSIALDDDLVSNGQITNQDFLSNVSADNKNGYIIYEKMQSLADDYIEDMEAYQVELQITGEYNDQVDKKLLVVKIFKQVVNLGLLGATGTTGFAQFATAWPAINFLKPNGGIDTTKSKDFFGKVEGILGEYANTFISESLKKKENPTKPVMPTVTLTEMQFSGTLTDEVYSPSILFSTPGSFKNSPTATNLPVTGAPQGYPVYNQPVGVFALLEAPKISQSISSKVATIKCEDIWEQNPDTNQDPIDPQQVPDELYVGVLSYRNTENRSQFKLKAPLVYTFNPGLDYKTKSISAMYVIKTKLKENNVSTGSSGLTILIPYRSKIYDKSINVNSSTINTYNNELIWDYSNLSSDINSGHIIFKKDSLVYTSEFIPIDAFNNYIVEVATLENDVEKTTTCSLSNGVFVNSLNQAIWDDFEVQIKLKVDVEYNSTHSNGDPHNYTYIFTYDVDNSNIIPVSTGPFIPNLSGSNADILQYPATLSYQTTTFNGGVVNGCELNGTTYTCQAWNTIEINGDINITSPYTVDFIAGNTITASPESIISPQSTLSIQQLLDYSNPMPEAKSDYVYGFCNGTNLGLPSYKGNTPTKNSNYSYGNPQFYDEIDQIETSWDFTIYPNPTSSTSTVVLSGNNETNYNVEVTDMMGKVVYTKGKRAETTQTVLDLTGISKGVYFVKVNTLLGTKMKQLIIQ